MATKFVGCPVCIRLVEMISPGSQDTITWLVSVGSTCDSVHKPSFRLTGFRAEYEHEYVYKKTTTVAPTAPPKLITFKAVILDDTATGYKYLATLRMVDGVAHLYVRFIHMSIGEFSGLEFEDVQNVSATVVIKRTSGINTRSAFNIFIAF